MVRDEATASKEAHMTRSDTTNTSGHAPVLSASSITGTKVLNPAGEQLGSIEDLMLDTDTGDIAYAVLSFGGFLGMGDKLFAIPWEALTIDTAAHSFVLDLDREKLEQAPGFDKDDWPTTADSTWMRDLHRHYGFEYAPRHRR
jgi:sporulation protein YlmC with PRC-barrel domain